MPLLKGPQNVTIPPRAGFIPVISIEADASFTAYSMDGTKRETILGPFKPDQRRVIARLPIGCKRIDVATAKSTFWQLVIDYRTDGKEYPDQTPIEVPLNMKKPESLRDTMRRFIREEFSREAVMSEKESFEEANDFDIDDETDLLSPYEITDMEPEYLQDEQEAPSEPTGAEPEVDGSKTEKTPSEPHSEPDNNQNTPPVDPPLAENEVEKVGH